MGVRSALLRFFARLAGFAMVVVAQAAHATIFSGAFTGTISAGQIDYNGLFGAGGAGLAGQKVSFTYSYDPSLAASSSLFAQITDSNPTGNPGHAGLVDTAINLSVSDVAITFP